LPAGSVKTPSVRFTPAGSSAKAAVAVKAAASARPRNIVRFMVVSIGISSGQFLVPG